MNQPTTQVERSAQPSGDTFDLKVNARGSWACCGTFKCDDYDLVVSSCELLVVFAPGKLVFKTLNEEGFMLERIDRETARSRP